MEIEIICKNMIKPSSPTPKHLKTYKLSYLDQSTPSIFTPTLLYFPTNQTTPTKTPPSQASLLLKQSLSDTLTHFYPFAGRIKDKLSICCTDDGVPFIEAQVVNNSISLPQFLSTKVNSFDLPKFLPHAADWNEQGIGSHVASVQITQFPCGGFVIGVFISHIIADGSAITTFLKAWAAETCSNASERIIYPVFDTCLIFPQSESFPKESTMIELSMSFLKKGRQGLRRFLFDAPSIAKLKAISHVQNPTRVEVVSAFLFKSITGVLNSKRGYHKPTVMTHSVNLRRRANPSFPESTMGNVFSIAAVICEKEEEVEMVELVRKMREEIRKYNEDFMNSIQGENGFVKYIEKNEEMGMRIRWVGMEWESKGGLECVGFSSWCNFGLYEVDFGWGRPVWMGFAGGLEISERVFMNMCFMVDTRGSDGIEVWAFLDEDDLVCLDQNQEFLSFVSVDSSPIQV